MDLYNSPVCEQAHEKFYPLLKALAFQAEKRKQTQFRNLNWYSLSDADEECEKAYDDAADAVVAYLVQSGRNQHWTEDDHPRHVTANVMLWMIERQTKRTLYNNDQYGSLCYQVNVNKWTKNGPYGPNLVPKMGTF